MVRTPLNVAGSTTGAGGTGPFEVISALAGSAAGVGAGADVPVAGAALQGAE